MNEHTCDFPGCETLVPDDHQTFFDEWQTLRDEDYEGGLFVFCPQHRFTVRRAEII